MTDILIDILERCSAANNDCQDCEISEQCRIFHDASDKLLIWQVKYFQARKREKGEILDAFVGMTGYDRDYARQILAKIGEDST